MHRAKGDKLLCANMLPVCGNGVTLIIYNENQLEEIISIQMVVLYSYFKKPTDQELWQRFLVCCQTFSVFQLIFAAYVVVMTCE